MHTLRHCSTRFMAACLGDDNHSLLGHSYPVKRKNTGNIDVMIPLVSFLTPPSQCGYLPNRTWQLHYEVVMSATASDYERRLLTGWRRFGKSFFRPKCPGCQACQSLRVDVARFRPDRSQRRNAKTN